MSNDKNFVDLRRTRYRDTIVSGFSIHKSRSPTELELTKWIEFFQLGGTLSNFLREIRSDISTSEMDVAVAGRQFGKNGGAQGLKVGTEDKRPNDEWNGMRVAIVSTYPPEPPQHGGQHRLRNIGFSYSQAGFAVKHVGVLGGSGYGQTAGFVDFPGGDELKKIMAAPSLMEDWVIGQMFGQVGPYLDAFLDAAGPVPDLIHVEQPWLFQMARRWAESDRTKNTRIIYGSQNIEHTLKFKIVKSYFGDDAAKDAREKVLEVELAAIKEADAVLAVSNDDCIWLDRYREDKSILAANGVAIRESTTAGLLSANELSQGSKFALVCASAHPPNISSMFEIFGGGFACFSPRERLVLAGGIGPALRADSRFSSNTSLHTFMSGGGIVSEECIQGLLETAHAILLPITSGEGSNLKTAEALWAGKHIIATRTAMRGFEAFTEAEGLVIAENAESFLHAIRAAMEKPPLVVSEMEKARRRALLWDATLKSMTKFALSNRAIQ